MPGSTQAIVERVVSVRVVDNPRWHNHEGKYTSFFINGETAEVGKTYEVSLTLAHELRDLGRVEIL